MEVKEVRVDLIDPNPLQVRQKFDEEKLNELTESIKQLDVISLPIIQRKGNRYQLVAGERRWRASIKAGATEILAVIRDDLSDFESLLISGSENIHRDDLSSVERENLIDQLWQIGKKEGIIENKADLARRLGVDPSHVSEIIRSYEFRKRESLDPAISTSVIRDTEGLPREERLKVLTRHKEGEIGSRDIREYVRAIKEASEPVKEVLLEVGSTLTLEEAIAIESKLETDKEKKRAIEILQREKEQRLGVVLEIAKERPKIPIMLNEIDTGYLWKCPICGEEYHLIHMAGEKKHSHKFEEVVK